MPLLSKKKNGCSSGCLAVKWIVCILLFLTSVAALVGVYQTHIGAQGLLFGSTGGSLALLAFAVNVTLWVKHMKCLCMGCVEGA